MVRHWERKEAEKWKRIEMIQSSFCGSAMRESRWSFFSDDVLEHVKDENLKNLLEQSKATHTKLGNTTHIYLLEYQDEGKRTCGYGKADVKIKK